MAFLRRMLAAVVTAAATLLPVAHAQAVSRPMNGASPDLQPEAEQIVALANQARTQAGVGRLAWDPALANAALKHCLRMAAEGQIAHRYGNEPDLSDRVAQAGAHFSVIEENVAVGPSADSIHQQWMGSQGHRENLLSADVDHIGVAVIAAHGLLYAVADYSRAVQQMNSTQVEARVAALVRPSGLTILSDPSVARAACTTDEGMPRAVNGMQPRFIMRWQDADLTQLPQELVQRLETGRYRAADVGSCPAQDAGGEFTTFRIAVILY
jgi:uncharacterized protein YkwD